MPRKVVVVSRNPGLGFGLESIGWEVVEVRDRELDELTAAQDTGDALVLDLRDPARAGSAVADLRSRGITTPVLLVAGGNPGWASVAAAELAATHILELPASRERLQSALDQLVGLRATPPLTSGAEPSAPPNAADDAPDTPQAQETQEAPDERTPSARRGRARHAAVPAPPAPPRLEGEPAPAADDLDGGTPEHAEETEPSGREPGRESDREPGEESGVADGALARVLAGQHVTTLPSATRPRGFPPPPASPSPLARAASSPGTAPPTLPQPSPAGDVTALVDALAARTDELYSVSETGQVVAEQALETVAADAAVVFVPDDGVWRVAGDIGLRPLERRVALSRDAWLVDVVALSHRGVVVEDSDIARSRLGGVPLAHHAHLLAVPVPAVDGLVLLARSEEPAFNEDDVAALAGLSREAGALLQTAVRARSLARGLSHLVAAPDAGR